MSHGGLLATDPPTFCIAFAERAARCERVNPLVVRQDDNAAPRDDRLDIVSGKMQQARGYRHGEQRFDHEVTSGCRHHDGEIARSAAETARLLGYQCTQQPVLHQCGPQGHTVGVRSAQPLAARLEIIGLGQQPISHIGEHQLLVCPGEVHCAFSSMAMKAERRTPR